MTFTSVEFLIFFPIAFLIYWIFGSNKTLQNVLIVVFSLLFYGWWNWHFLALLLVTTLTSFYGGTMIQKAESNWKTRKLALVSVIVTNLGILFFFKYYDFFVNSFVDAFSLFGSHLSASTLNLILPVGISFYTFSALSYSIDVYQRKIAATNDLLAYCAYTMFFPSILSGPISRADKQLPQYFRVRKFSYGKAMIACELVLMGAVMKLCLADRLGIYVDAVYSNIIQHSGITLFFSSILYTIQIYADFAGYSLMAIGCGKLFGIELQTNFIRPYFSKTVTEFWRRWHISLTTWFRDYIYFPLGGNRVGKIRWMFNTMVVFIVSGLWHGAAYSFLIWGALHGVCMIIERLMYGRKIKEIESELTYTNILRILLTFSIISFAWIFFRADSLSDAIEIITKIVTNNGTLFVDIETWSLALLALIIVFAYDLAQEYKLQIRFLDSRHRVIRYVTTIFLLCYIIGFGVLNGGSFIYFQF